MKWRVILMRTADKELRDLSAPMRRRVDRELTQLADDPYHRSVAKLADGSGYRARVGSYRVLYVVNESARQVDVWGIRHRREAYR